MKKTETLLLALHIDLSLSLKHLALGFNFQGKLKIWYLTKTIMSPSLEKTSELHHIFHFMFFKNFQFYNNMRIF